MDTSHQDHMGVPGTTVLVIELNPALRDALARQLTRHGYVVTPAENHRQGLHLFFTLHPHVVLMGLEGEHPDPWNVLRRIREVADTPVILYADKEVAPGISLRALQSAATDVVSCASGLEELVLRLQALVRRNRLGKHPPVIYDDGILYVDTWRRRVTVAGRPVHLSRAEFAVLSCLVQRPNQVTPYDEIYQRLAEVTTVDADPSLATILYRIRRKLSAISPTAPRIVSQRNVGVGLITNAPVR